MKRSTTADQPFLLMEGITKRYSINGVLANDNVRLEVRSGEIHALVGENGAGKTTLVRILDGMEHADRGRIVLRGREVSIHSPRQALNLGIGLVHQHFRLIPEFSVTDNIVLGSEPRKARFFYNRREAAERVKELMREHGFAIDPQKKIRSLTIAQIQQVEILKTLYRQSDLLVLDEPTDVLAREQIGELFLTLRNLVAHGRTVILITHKLKEVVELSDRVTVLRRGRTVAVRNTADIDETKLTRLIMGRRDVPPLERKRHQAQELIYEIRNISLHTVARKKPVLESIDLTVRRGEIHGLTGITGNGLSELEDIVSGFHPGYELEGKVYLHGQEITHLTPKTLRKRRMAWVPSNRLFRGVSLDASFRENLILNSPNSLYPFGFFDPRKSDEFLNRITRPFRLNVRPNLPIGFLSGGNIQKAILARELANAIDFVLFAEPGWGLDVAATIDVYRQILALRERGVAILLISTDLDVILELSDRITVLYRGRIAAKFSHDPSREEVGRARLGLAGDEE